MRNPQYFYLLEILRRTSPTTLAEMPRALFCGKSMKIELKKPNSKNTHILLSLAEEYYSFENMVLNRKKVEKAVLDLVKNNKYGFLKLICVDEQIIGYLCIAYGYSLQFFGPDCFLDEIYISKGYRRKGIGTIVFRKLEKQLKKEGIKAIHLEVFKGNKKAYNFYLKNGFECHKATFMSKKL